ncbi:MAG TPA: glycine cleavage system aminomethyltransferase GcvT [Thermoanaerobaculia bacterium]|jgi:aminomethyltransferase|nr:glycine cleavage system aminomethyltransferase GcvT [Thermoanaerobaculia bacterium]
MLATPALRRTPLFECHRESGAKLVPFAGWEMPVQYEGVIEEHRAVRQAAGLFDVSHMGEIAVRGPGALRFLDWLTPNQVSKLVPGRAHYSGLLTEQGTYVDDLLVYRLGESDFLLVVNAANRDKDLDWVRRHAPADTQIDDVSDRYALLALQGPRALEILAPLTEVDLASLRYYGFAAGTMDGHRALVSRTGYTGEDGFELYVDPEAAAPLWRRLLAAGGPLGLVPAGLGARDTLRLEAGMALYGHELDAATTPLEAGLSWVVKLDKGDFLGSAELLRQQREGVARRLVGFTVTGRGIAREGHEVRHAGSRVGQVTSGTWSPTFEKALGMAYVQAGHAAPGVEVEIEVRGKALPASLAEIPFYRRGR